MWTCPRCKRNFKINNQSHFCSTKDIGELFLNRPDELVLAYDTLVQLTAKWTPNSVGNTDKAIIFTNNKAWLIVKPMKKLLDLKFYSAEFSDHPRLHQSRPLGKNYVNHIRIQHEAQFDHEILDLLRIGYDFALS